MEMYQSIRIKLDPTPKQIRKMKSHLHGSRFVFNYMLGYIEDHWTDSSLCKISGRSIRDRWNQIKDEVAPWHRENSKGCYNTACEDLAQAWKNFFDGRNEKRPDKPNKPQYKKKGEFGSYRLDDEVKLRGDYGVFLPKAVGRVHCFENVRKRINGRKVVHYTITHESSGWYIGICMRVDSSDYQYNAHTKDYVGIDLGVKTLATLSDKTKVENPRFDEKKSKRLKHYQRMMSRRQGAKEGEKKSKRFKKARNHVRKAYKKSANQRRDYIHKATTEICKTYKIIAVEGFNTMEIKQKANHKLAARMNDASMGTFRILIERKARRFNNIVYRLDQYYPSTKICSHCGSLKAKVSLKQRTYRCFVCGHEIDRDLNAAINLEQVARGTQETINAHGGIVRRIPMEEIEQLSKKCESGLGTHLVIPEVLAGNGETSELMTRQRILLRILQYTNQYKSKSQSLLLKVGDLDG